MNSPSDLPVSRAAATASETNRRRGEALLLFPLESLQYLDRDSAVRCQAMMGHGDQFGMWETPPTLVGRRLWKSHANINLRERLVRYLPNTSHPSDSLDTLIDAGVLWMTRYALLCRMGPAVNGKNKGSSLDATSLINNLIQYVPKIIAPGIARRLMGAASELASFVGSLTVDDLDELKKVRHIGYEFKRMTVFADRGLWSDAPVKHKLPKNTDPKGSAMRPPRRKNPLLFPRYPTITLPRWGRASCGWCRISAPTCSNCSRPFLTSSATSTLTPVKVHSRRLR